MSILKVDTINEKTSGNGVQIAGHVVQVVQGTSTSYLVLGSNNTHVDTGLTATITPKSASSKILILHSSAILGTATHDIILRLLRGSTNIHNLNFWSDNSNYTFMTGAFQYLDSPSTTSATAYKTQVYKKQNDLLYNYVNEVISKSPLTLMEIAQ